VQARAVFVEEFGDQPIRVEPEVSRVLPNECARKETSRQDVHAVVLERLQEASADLGRLGHVAQADAAELAFATEAFAKRRHARSLLLHVQHCSTTDELRGSRRF
jgi:hypothetical protein